MQSWLECLFWLEAKHIPPWYYQVLSLIGRLFFFQDFFFFNLLQTTNDLSKMNYVLVMNWTYQLIPFNTKSRYDLDLLPEMESVLNRLQGGLKEPGPLCICILKIGLCVSAQGKAKSPTKQTTKTHATTAKTQTNKKTNQKDSKELKLSAKVSFWKCCKPVHFTLKNYLIF